MIKCTLKWWWWCLKNNIGSVSKPSKLSTQGAFEGIRVTLLKQRLFLRYLPLGQIPRQHNFCGESTPIMDCQEWCTAFHISHLWHSLSNKAAAPVGSGQLGSFGTEPLFLESFMIERFENVCFEDIFTCRENVRARSVSTPPAGGSTISWERRIRLEPYITGANRHSGFHTIAPFVTLKKQLSTSFGIVFIAKRFGLAFLILSKRICPHTSVLAKNVFIHKYTVMWKRKDTL